MRILQLGSTPNIDSDFGQRRRPIQIDANGGRALCFYTASTTDTHNNRTTNPPPSEQMSTNHVILFQLTEQSQTVT